MVDWVFDSQLGHTQGTKDFKIGIGCFSCFNAQHKETVSDVSESKH